MDMAGRLRILLKIGIGQSKAIERRRAIAIKANDVIYRKEINQIYNIIDCS